MAGAEIEPGILRKYLKERLAIGFIAFLLPFIGAMLFAHYVAGWAWPPRKYAVSPFLPHP
jgi:Kef-type K+ transport system membrane component KefB